MIDTYRYEWFKIKFDFIKFRFLTFTCNQTMCATNKTVELE